MYVSINLKTIKFYLIKLATDCYSQPSYLLGERFSLSKHPNNKDFTWMGTSNTPAYSENELKKSFCCLYPRVTSVINKNSDLRLPSMRVTFSNIVDICYFFPRLIGC